jgi:aspartyl-tRNA synthetase
MKRTYIKDLKDYIGKEVTIDGFIQVIRNQGGIKFLLIRDITGLVQIVILKTEKEVFDLIKELTLESVVQIDGLVKEEKQAPGGFEIQAKKITILSQAESELPIPILEKKGGKETDAPIRFDWRWLDLRKEAKAKIIRTWTEFERGFRDYFEKNNYLQIYTPSFMGTASESGADAFEVKYFDRKAYLAQSPQFYKQMAMAAGFEKVFVTGPVFRAELSFTTRHMTEFTGLDFEISYIESHHDIMEEEEKLLVETFKRLNNKLDLNLEIPTIPFPKITMKEAKEKLAKRGIKSVKIFDLSSEEEVALSKMIKEETDHDFVFLIDWPVEGRPFYHMRHENNPRLTKSFDLLYKGLEVTTGAQREHRPDVLEKQAKEKDVDLESLRDYINFFRYGCPPHGGVGMGLGRLIQRILNLPSVKEATFLPRDVKRLRP